MAKMKDIFEYSFEFYNYNKILFYRSNGNYGFLSNLYNAKIEFENRIFPNSEFAYQFGKFKDEKVREWAMNCPNSHLLSILSHNLFVYDIVENWSKIKVERMKKVLKAKFTQHNDLKEKLLNTNNKTLIENSKSDSFWGIGKNEKGKNMLGKLLMELREELRNTGDKK